MVKFMKRTLMAGITLAVTGLILGVIGFYAGGKVHGFEKAYSHNTNHIEFNIGNDSDDDDN
ncbi:hypothetical protein [Fructilactobacillus carniphilus]|uniref:Uncharacterized protein n=1 Tax=Fructilactobacillus carniphilus TaxID=2940297 RepID=A0ABY5BWQ3_9LACO|nr:hypothetical protein [Fructilactobacillus carniphilus]USS90398.1 hypothetical protein M3M37_06030 [Fructilactobacillus carniphilus]